MNIAKAQEILAYNRLNLPAAGLDFLKLKTVNIHTYAAGEDDEREITLLAVIGKGKNNERICFSFFVNHNQDYWYRDFLDEANEVVEALKIILKEEVPNKI